MMFFPEVFLRVRESVFSMEIIKSAPNFINIEPQFIIQRLVKLILGNRSCQKCRGSHMELEFTDEGIIFEKVLNPLDEFTLDFTKVLQEVGVEYCIISGYVAILFGRSRASEDVDIFIEHLEKVRFRELWERLKENFECIITSYPDDAYDTYLSEGLAVRFSRKGKFIPNIEVKFPWDPINRWTLENRQQVTVNDHIIHISPMEVQIPYKLKLGSDKDIEDAIHLYSIFRDELNTELFLKFLHRLGQEDTFRRYLD